MDIGDQIGHYRLEALLGEGSQAEVWRATMQGPGSFQRAVALRWMLDANPSTVIREHRLGGLLRHPHLVEVYEIDANESATWVAQELMAGGTLYEAIRDEPLSPRAVAELGHALAQALAHLHEKGLVHRDVTPANVLLTDTGIPKLGDLGLAMWVDEALDGDRSGTPGFRSPEQRSGQVIDGRSDIFSLGCLLFQAATARPLAGAATAEYEDIPEQIERALGTHPPMAQALLRCLKPDAEQRWTASQAAKGFAALLDSPGRGLAASLGADPGATGSFRRLGSLPRPADGWVGRHALLEQAEEKLARGSPVLTLHGPGGCGKTQLGLRALQLHHPPGGCWWVDLSLIRDPAMVIEAIAGALGMVLQQEDALAQVGFVLSARPDLCIFLDNAEHVLAETARVVGSLLGMAPRVQWLITSREELGIPAELVLPVEPMTLIEQRELFQARARGHGWDGADEDLLDDLLLELGGLPLAIELAAGQVADAGLRAMTGLRAEQHLDEGLLHPAMEATLARSWALIGPSERSTLAQLSVFRGDFDLEAAEEVVLLPEDDEAWVLDVLDTLLRKALLAQREFRFRLYEPVRQFARAHADTTTRSQAEIRHGHWFATIPPSVARETGVEQAMQRIRDDIDNLVAAWERAVARGDTDCAQRTAQPLIDFYASRGPYSRERDIIKQTWALPVNDPSVRACFAVFASRAYGRHGDMENCSALLDHANQFREVLVDEGLDLELTYALGMQANHKGEFEEATRVFAEVIEEARARGQWHTVARAATASGTTLQRLGKPKLALELCEQALEAARRVDAAELETLICGNLGGVYTMYERWDEAREQLETGLARCEGRSPTRYHCVLFSNLAGLIYLQEGTKAAIPTMERAIDLAITVGDYALAGQSCLDLGEFFIEFGAYEDAESRLEQGLGMCRRAEQRLFTGYGLMMLGRLRNAQGLPEQALVHLAEGLPLLEQVKFAMGTALAYCGLAEAHLALEQVDEAGQWLDKASAVYAELQHGQKSQVQSKLEPLLEQYAART